MKKFFRFLGILILILLVIFLVTALVAPKDIKIERSVTMNAPKELVFEQMVKFRNWPAWSPWYEMEPTVKMTYYGTDGQPGSGYTWKGEKTGEGDMKNVGVSGTTVNYQLTFKEPFENQAHGMLKAEDAGSGKTNATWTFETHMSFPMNGLMAIISAVTGGVGKDFEKGLNNMKAYVESGKATMVSPVEIKEVQFPEHDYAIIRKTVNWNDMSDFFMKAYDTLGKTAGPRINGAPVGLYYTWDTVNHQTDMAAGFPVSGPVKGVAMTTIPASNAYMVAYHGPYSGMMAVHNALGKKLDASGKTHVLVLEEYIVTPTQQKDSTKLLTNIYYLYK
jgi:effector-binding domain-containing protein